MGVHRDYCGVWEDSIVGGASGPGIRAGLGWAKQREMEQGVCGWNWLV